MFQRMQKNCLHFFYLLAACNFFYTTSVALFWNRTNIPMMVVAVACGLAVAFLLHKLIFSPGFSMVAEDPRKRRLVIAGISGLFLALCLASAFLQLEDFSGCDWDIWVIHTEAENVARNPSLIGCSTQNIFGNCPTTPFRWPYSPDGTGCGG